MVGAGITVRPNSRIAVLGNSIAYGTGTSSFVTALGQSIANTYSAPRTPGRTVPGVLPSNASLPAGADAGAPTWFIAGAPGAIVQSISTLIAAVIAFKPDTVIIELETNDAHLLVADATYSTGVADTIAQLLAGCPALTASQILWLQALCIGEKHPFGSNPTDTVANGLMGKDAVLRTQAAALGFSVAESRLDAAGNGVWNTYEVANNLGNASSGVLMTGDTLHELTYPARVGLDFYVNSVILPAITIAGVG